MSVLEQITPKNVLAFKAARLNALKDSPISFGSTYANESLISDVDWLKRAADWSSGRSVGYLAMDEGIPCGIAAGFLNERDPCLAHLVSMWVAPTYRRTGIGRVLISTVQGWARDSGAHTLLLTVTSSNRSAIEFYERNGFSMTGNTEPYPNDPALFEYEMSQTLAVKHK